MHSEAKSIAGDKKKAKRRIINVTLATAHLLIKCTKCWLFLSQYELISQASFIINA
jgi:hypothetical protein